MRRKFDGAGSPPWLSLQARAGLCAKGWYPDAALAKSKILVVDDDRAVLKSLQRILLADGYDVECSSSAREALEIMAAQPPDVILLDMMMPAMNGRQFLEALRDDGGFTHIPVVVITGVRGIDIKQAESMGACDVIEKPFNIEQLLDKVALVLFRHRREAPASPTSAGDVAVNDDARPIPAAATGPVIVLTADTALNARMDVLLRQSGYQLVSLIRANDELPLVASALTPSAIIVDLHIPGTPGMDALHNLRANSDLDTTPMLLIARDTRALDDVREQLSELAIVPLTQPFDDRDIHTFLTHPPDDARRQQS